MELDNHCPWASKKSQRPNPPCKATNKTPNSHCQATAAKDILVDRKLGGNGGEFEELVGVVLLAAVAAAPSAKAAALGLDAPPVA